MSNTTELSTDQIQQLIDGVPMANFMGIRVESWDAGNDVLTCVMPLRPELCNFPDPGSFHGGAIASLIDTVTCIAVIGKGHKMAPTTNIRVDYFRPAVNTRLKCVAKIRRIGRTGATVDADVLNDAGKLVAVGRCGLLILS